MLLVVEERRGGFEAARRGELGKAAVADVVVDSLGAVGERPAEVDPSGAVGMLQERGRPYEEAVHHAEHGSVGPDAEA